MTIVTAAQLQNTFNTLNINKTTLVAIVNNTEEMVSAANIVNTMVSGFFQEDLINMLPEVKQAVELLNEKFPVYIVETVRYCGDMEIIEVKSIDFKNDKIITISNNVESESEMTEKDFDNYTTWLSDIKKVMK